MTSTRPTTKFASAESSIVSEALGSREEACIDATVIRGRKDEWRRLSTVSVARNLLREFSIPTEAKQFLLQCICC